MKEMVGSSTSSQMLEAILAQGKGKRTSIRGGDCLRLEQLITATLVPVKGRRLPLEVCSVRVQSSC